MDTSRSLVAVHAPRVTTTETPTLSLLLPGVTVTALDVSEAGVPLVIVQRYVAYGCAGTRATKMPPGVTFAGAEMAASGGRQWSTKKCAVARSARHPEALPPPLDDARERPAGGG